MPAVDFTAAIIVIGSRTDELDPTVLTTLQEEDCILVRSLTPEIDQPREQRFAASGRNILTAYAPPRLTWQIEAQVLAYDGLANYHPGTPLSRRLLPCANASYRRPWQMGPAGTLVYEAPRLVNAAGTLPTISFSIAEHCPAPGASLDTDTFPAIFPAGILTIIPTESTPREIAPLTALLSDVFQNIDAFGPGQLQASWYDGDPAATGTPVTSPVTLTLAHWTLSEPTLPYVTTAALATPVQWDPQSGERRLTHLRITRGPHIIRDIQLTAPVIVSPGRTIHLPAGAITLQLTWPLDGEIGGLTMPSRWLLAYALGGPRTTYIPSGSYLTLEAHDADPISPGTGALQTSWDITPTAAAFGVTGTLVTPIALTSPAVAPSGGWDIAYITLTLHPANIIVLKEEYTATIAETAALTIDATPTLDLTIAPD